MNIGELLVMSVKKGLKSNFFSNKVNKIGNGMRNDKI